MQNSFSITMINGIMLSCSKKDYSVRSKESSSSVFQLRLDFFLNEKKSKTRGGIDFHLQGKGKTWEKEKRLARKDRNPRVKGLGRVSWISNDLEEEIPARRGHSWGKFSKTRTVTGSPNVSSLKRYKLHLTRVIPFRSIRKFNWFLVLIRGRRMVHKSSPL